VGNPLAERGLARELFVRVQLDEIADNPAKLTTSDSVMVRPRETCSTPTVKSS